MRSLLRKTVHIIKLRNFYAAFGLCNEKLSVVESSVIEHNLLPEICDGGGTVMIIHPKVRWGSHSASVLKSPPLQLQEAVSLVNTIPNFRVVESLVVGVDYSTKRKTIWGRGSLERLMQKREESRASAVMINTEMLSPLQTVELSKAFGVPVYDRFRIVLAIFKEFAITEEAHIQIKLARIPFIKSNLYFLAKRSKLLENLTMESGPLNAESLRLYEQHLRKKLNVVLQKKEQEMSQGARLGEFPIVAIVGYTNAGKTTLVKKLTGADSLVPMNRLFATLETTSFSSRLPSGRKTLFLDTIGFLSDLPSHLFAAFEATLRHVKLADVVVHLRDVSHPAWKAQAEDVVRTLSTLGMTDDQLDRIITVDNKIDLAEEHTSGLRISCKTGEGVENVISVIDQSVMQAVGSRPRRLVLKPQSPGVQFLYGNGFAATEPTIRNDMLVFDVFMTDTEFSRFQASLSNY